jgi:hypothetical protein
MDQKLFPLFVIVCGFASLTVWPIVAIDVFATSIFKDLKPQDWAAWVQAAGSILAVAAAASIAVYQQYENQRSLREQLNRKNLAARALLPAALAELMEYINECLDCLAHLKESGVATTDELGQGFLPPELPKSVLPAIRDCVEFADEGPRERLADLATQLQIQASRLSLSKSPRSNMIIHGDAIAGLFVDALDTHARASMLFNYSRRSSEIDPGPPTKSDLSHAAIVCNLWDDELIQRKIDHRYDQGGPIISARDPLR